MVFADLQQGIGLPAANADIPSQPAERQAPDRSEPATVSEAGPDSVAALSAVSTTPSLRLVGGAADLPAAEASPVEHRSPLLRFGAAAGDMLRRVLDGEYRRATARETHLGTLSGDGPLDGKYLAAQALGPLVRGEGAEPGTAGKSIEQAVVEMKIILNSPQQDWRVRTAVLGALRQHYETKGEPQPQFARELAVLLNGEQGDGMRLGLISALAKSRDPFVQETLLEHLGDNQEMIAMAASDALKLSYRLRHTDEMEGKLLARANGTAYQDPRDAAIERTAALNVLSAHQRQRHYSDIADIIENPAEPPALRMKALECYGRISDKHINSALAELATQDESSKLQWGLIDGARQLLAQREPRLVFKTEAGLTVDLSVYAA